jgi:predicted 3-demethylubiquinone-9 3-methyltransferase (glyoxalase superfamily)
MPAITPFLWFDKEAEEAAKFYVSVFPDSKITQVARYGEAGPGPKGSVMTVEFELDGKPFTALNAGPLFKFNESVSFVIHCRDQAQVDHYWEKLVEGGGEHSACGWLKDRYGLSWQVTPDILLELVTSPDTAKSQRAMKAMMQMAKIDIAALKKAVEI